MRHCMIHHQTRSDLPTWPPSWVQTSTNKQWQLPPKSRMKKRKCFKFARGNCREEQCKYRHDESQSGMDKQDADTTPPQEKEPRQDIGETEAHLPQLHDTTHFHQDTVMQADAIEATLLPRISEAMVRDLQALGKDVDKDKKVKKVEKVKKDLLPPIPFLLVTRVKIWSNGGHVRPGLANKNTEGTRATKKNATTTWPTKQHTHTYGHSEDATSFILQKARKVNGSWDAKPPPEARFSS